MESAKEKAFVYSQVDSEHNAIFSVLTGGHPDESVAKLIFDWHPVSVS